MLKHLFRPLCGSIALGVGFLAAIAGCAVDLAPDAPEPNGQIDATDGVVTVRFRNFTVSDAVDVEFYTSSQPLVDISEELFVAENLLRMSLGVAGTGIVQPLKEDLIELPCSEDLSIGTLGGSFVDNESGESSGRGSRRWVQEGPLGLCDAIVTFEFTGADGEFSTTVSITH